jgi:hypothetical protein
LAENSEILRLCRLPCASYQYLDAESEALGRAVFFNVIWIYIITYDATTFVSVMAYASLGKNLEKIPYANGIASKAEQRSASK